MAVHPGLGRRLGSPDGPFVARYRVTAPSVSPHGLDGKIRQFYEGDELDWLSDDEAARYLRLGHVEAITPRDPADYVPPDVKAVVSLLDTLGVPSGAGAPTAAQALRGHGARIANQVIADAVRVRKTRLADRDAHAESVGSQG